MNAVEPDRSIPSARSVRICAWLVALMLAFYLTGMRVEMNVVYPPASIENLMAHSAPTPYQYRIFVPALVRSLYGIGAISSDVIGPRELGMILEAIALLGAYACVRALLRILGASDEASSIVALSIFLLLPFQFLLSRMAPYWYVWDAPAVMFFSLGLWLLRVRNWSFYYLVFALATLNKETAIFLTVIHVLGGWGETPRKTLAIHATAQAAIWLAIKLGLARAFAGNSGMGLIPNVLDQNFWSLRTPASLLQIASCFGFLWIPVLFLRRRIEDRFFRRAVLVFVPYFACALVSGELTELRIFSELTPLIVIGLYGVCARTPARSLPASP